MHQITFSFDDLPTIITPDGFEAGEVSGCAEIRFTDDGEFFIKEICLDGSRRNSKPHPTLGSGIRVPFFDRKPVSLERDNWLYRAIHDQLENGRFRASVESAVSSALSEFGVPVTDMNAEHRINVGAV